MKSTAVTLIACAVCGSAFAADTNTATITFTGRIIEEACRFSTDTGNQTINLGVYPQSYFTNRDTTTEAKPFSLKIEGCTITKTDVGENLPADRIRLTFTDTNSSGSQSNGLLANENTEGAAENVGILVNYKSSDDTTAETQLFEDSATGTQVRTLNQFSYASDDSDSVREATLDFTAAMKPTSDTMPTVGQVKGQMTVLLETF